MKYFNKFISVIIFLFLFTHSSLSQENVFFIDIDYLVQNSNIGKKSLKIITDLDKKNVGLLEKKNKDLISLENEIKNKKNVISEEEFKKEVLSFKQKLNDFTNEKNTIVKEFNSTKQKELENLFKLFNPIISNYMKQNNINILLDSKNVFMGSPDNNITNNIIEEINKELK